MFLDEFAQILSLEGATKNSYTLLNIDNKGLHLAGNLKILNCTTVKIDVSINKKHFIILGENLKIKQLSTGSLFVNGKIYGFFDSTKINI